MGERGGMFVYVGCYTTAQRCARGDGIHVYRVHEETGGWSHVQHIGGLVNPSFLALRPDGRFLYSAHGDETYVSAFAVDPESGRLAPMNRAGTGGRNGAHAAVDPGGRFLLVANYTSGNVTVLEIQPDGALGERVQLVALPGQPGPHPLEQTGSHPHQVIFDPSGRFVAVPDKGLDRIFVFRFDPESGRLTSSEQGGAIAPCGAAPRHLAFHPKLGVAWVVNEIDSTVATYCLDAEHGMRAVQILRLLPPGLHRREHGRGNRRFVGRPVRLLLQPGSRQRRDLRCRCRHRPADAGRLGTERRPDSTFHRLRTVLPIPLRGQRAVRHCRNIPRGLLNRPTGAGRAGGQAPQPVGNRFSWSAALKEGTVMYRYTLVALLFSSLAAAQEFRGTVLGRLTDPTGAIVPRAGVDVKNAETGASFKTTSNESGNYQVPFLLPGNYTIRVEAPGFKAVERSGIRVSTGGLVTVDFQLEVGVTSDSITVAADPPLLDTASADLGQVVTREFVQTLEFSTDRNIASLALLAPGVNGNDGGTYTAATHANISINGGGGTQGDNEYLVDGIPNTTAGGAPVFLPAIDAVDEFKVHTTMFDASMGHTNGGVISLTTRGGTNELHGTGYWYARRTSLMANGWTNNRSGNPRPPVKYDQFGYLVGGPVYIPRFYDGRNRTFFSNSLETDNDNRNLTPQFRVPTAPERQGDFSQTLNRLGGPLTIFDPATTVVTGANIVTRQPFAGNRIPAARITPIGSALMKLFPEPTLNVPAQIGRLNWTPGGFYNVKQRNMMIRGDHIISDNQRVFARFGRALRLNAPGQIFYPSYRGGNVGFGDTAFTNFGFDDTVTFSPRLVGTIRLGIVRRAGGNKIGGGRPRREGVEPARRHRPQPVLPGLSADCHGGKLSQHRQQPVFRRQRYVLARRHLHQTRRFVVFEVRLRLPGAALEHPESGREFVRKFHVQQLVHAFGPLPRRRRRHVRHLDGLPPARRARLWRTRLQQHARERRTRPSPSTARTTGRSPRASPSTWASVGNSRPRSPNASTGRAMPLTKTPAFRSTFPDITSAAASSSPASMGTRGAAARSIPTTSARVSGSPTSRIRKPSCAADMASSTA